MLNQINVTEKDMYNMYRFQKETLEDLMSLIKQYVDNKTGDISSSPITLDTNKVETTNVSNIIKLYARKMIILNNMRIIGNFEIDLNSLLNSDRALLEKYIISGRVRRRK
jgi:hypothetical protein